MKTLKNVLWGMSAAFFLASTFAGEECPTLSVNFMIFCVVCAAAGFAAEFAEWFIRYLKKNPAREYLEQAPELCPHRLTHPGLYIPYDAQTAELTIEIINREDAKNDVQSDA